MRRITPVNQPPLYGLSTSDPLAHRLKVLWFFNQGGGFSIPTLGNGGVRSLVHSGTSSWRQTRRGCGVSSNGTSGVFRLANADPLIAGAGFSIWWAGEILSTSNGTLGLCGFRGSPDCYLMHLFTTGVEARVNLGGGNGDASFSGVTAGFHTMGLAYDGTTAISYYDGVLKTSAAVPGGGFWTPGAGAQNFEVNNDGAGGNYGLDPVIAAGLWGRNLVAADFMSLHVAVFGSLNAASRKLVKAGAGAANLPPGLGPVVGLTMPNHAGNLAASMR